MALIVEGYRELMEWWQTRAFLRPFREAEPRCSRTWSRRAWFAWTTRYNVISAGEDTAQEDTGRAPRLLELRFRAARLRPGPPRGNELRRARARPHLHPASPRRHRIRGRRRGPRTLRRGPQPPAAQRPALAPRRARRRRRAALHRQRPPPLSRAPTRRTRDSTGAGGARHARGPRARGRLEQALGWVSLPLRRDQRRMLWHNGGTGGFRSFLGFVPDTGVGVVVLSNSARSVDAIGFRILESIGRAAEPVAAGIRCRAYAA